MKSSLCFIYILCLSIFSSKSLAQKEKIKQVKIGEQIPNVLINKLINYSANTVKISDFKGKLIIFDFWGVHCASCIREMPDMQKLQEEFNGEIQIFLVTIDSKNEIDKLYKSSSFFRNIHLPIIFEDKILSQMFPYNAYGLHVWIDQYGVVQYKTDGRSYTAEDIRAFLKGETVKLIERSDTLSFNKDVPLWLEGNGRQLRHFKYYSYISDNISDYAGGGGSIKKDSVTDKIIGINFINSTIIDLFSAAYSEWGKRKWDMILLNVADSSKYFSPPDKTKQYEWFVKNTYAYALQLPVSKSSDVFTIMKQDLERYFGLISKTNKISQKVWTLVVDTNFSSMNFDYSNQFQLNVRNELTETNGLTIIELTRYLSELAGGPVFNETNLKESFSVCLPILKTFDEMKAVIEKLGFKLSKNSRWIEVLEIKEKYR